MKKLFLTLILILGFAVVVFAQGRGERYSDSPGEAVDGMATRSITNYNHTKADVTVPLAATGTSTVSKFCVFSTKALKFYVNNTSGDYRTIPASTEYCRTVRKGVTAAVFGGASSASTRIEFERSY